MLAIIHRFELRRRHVANRLQKPVVVEPINPFECGVLDIVELAPRTTAVNDLGLEQPEDRFDDSYLLKFRSLRESRVGSHCSYDQNALDGCVS